MRSRDRAEAGLGLIDALIALSLLGVVMTSMATAIAGGQRLFQSGMSRSQVEMQVARALNRIRETLQTSDRSAVANLLQAPLWSDELAFDRPVGFDLVTGAATASATRIALVPEEGELDDDADNDGDGFVDERRILLIRNEGTADEEVLVLCSNVCEYLEGESPNGIDDNGNGLIDEPGLVFERSQDDLNVRLSLQAHDGQGNTWIRTLETTILLRN